MGLLFETTQIHSAGTRLLLSVSKKSMQGYIMTYSRIKTVGINFDSPWGKPQFLSELYHWLQQMNSVKQLLGKNWSDDLHYKYKWHNPLKKLYRITEI